MRIRADLEDAVVSVDMSGVDFIPANESIQTIRILITYHLIILSSS